MRISLLLASVATALLGACLPAMDQTPDPNPNPNPNPTPNATPRQQFDSDVAPLLSNCTGCHVGAETNATDMFLGTENTKDSYYAGITNDRRVSGEFVPGQAELLTKGAHENGSFWWSDAQKATIGSWLQAEATARAGMDQGSADGSDTGSDTGSGTTANPDTTAQGAEAQWAACLTVAQSAFTSTKVATIARMQTEDGACYSCHEPGGAGGAYWGIENQGLDMLTKWSTELFITGAFQAVAQNTTPVTYKMATAQTKICNKGTEVENGTGTHPSFNCQQTVNGTQPLAALEAFRAQVQTMLDSGMCPAPGFTPLQ